MQCSAVCMLLSIFEGVHALGHYCHVFLGLVLAGMHTPFFAKEKSFDV